MIEQLRALQVESVAISFLHSYRNPEHELLVAEAIAEHLPNIQISTSVDVAPIAGEYERTSTVAADAFTKPAVVAYVGELSQALTESGVGANLSLMLSSGEIASVTTATKRPIRLLESGPASGAIAAAFFGEISGHPDVLSLRYGGHDSESLCH